MTEPKFTPAPWMLDEDGEVLDCNNDSIALLEIDDFDAEIEQELKANANLIAAAPDLYDALVLCTDLFAAYARHHLEKGDELKCSVNKNMADKCRSVLAKARGET